MTVVQHVYVTAHGTYKTGSWVGEGAQFGLRLAIANSTALPDKGTIFTPEVNGDVATDQGLTAGTNGTLTRTWTARLGETGSNENADAAWQIDLAEDVRIFLNDVKGYTSSAFSWDAIKLAPVSAAGRTIGTSSVYTFTTPLAGTGSALLPPQLAIAVTLRANILGRRGRGRIYLPACAGVCISSAGVLVSASMDTVRAAMVTLIGNLENPPGTPVYQPLVVVTSAGAATVVRPSQVRTGQRMDTIRSRREQVPETYTTTQL